MLEKDKNLEKRVREVEARLKPVKDEALIRMLL